MLKRAAREIGRRQTPILGYRHMEGSFVSGFLFAQEIIRRYQPVDAYNLPAALVYLSQSIKKEEEEKIRELVKNISVINQFRISVARHTYEEQHFLSLRTRCEQLFSFLSQSAVWQRAVRELRQIYQGIQKETWKKTVSFQEKTTREVWKTTREKITRIEREIGEKIRISHRNTFFSRRWIDEREKRKKIHSLLWKSERAKQFFWRVQRASKPEQTIILAAAKESSLSGLLNRLNVLDEESWLNFSQNLKEESEYLLENQEFMDFIARSWMEEHARKEIKKEEARQFTEEQRQFLSHHDSIWKIRHWLKQHSLEAEEDETKLEKKEFLALLGEENGEESWIWNQINKDVFHRKIKQNTDWHLSAAEAISYLSLEEWKTLKSEIARVLSSRTISENAQKDFFFVLKKETSSEQSHQEYLMQMSEEKRELMDILMQHKEDVFFEQLIKDSSVFDEYIQWETVKEDRSLTEEIEILSKKEWKDWKSHVFLQIQELETTIFPKEEDKVFLAEIHRTQNLKRRKDWLYSIMEAVSYLDSREWQKLNTEFWEGLENLTEMKEVQEVWKKGDCSPILKWMIREKREPSSTGTAEKRTFLKAVSAQMEEETRLARSDYQISEQLLKTSQVLSEYVRYAYTAFDCQEDDQKSLDSVFLKHLERSFDEHLSEHLEENSENWLPFFLEGMQKTTVWENQRTLLRLAAEAVSHLTLNEWESIKENFLENDSHLLKLSVKKIAGEEINSQISEESVRREREEFIHILSQRIENGERLTEREDELLRQLIKICHVSRRDELETVSGHDVLNRILYGLSENISSSSQLEEKAGWIQSVSDMIFSLEEKEWESFKTELWNVEYRRGHKEHEKREYTKENGQESADKISLPVLNWLIKEKEHFIKEYSIREQSFQEGRGLTDVQKSDTGAEKKKFLQRLFQYISVQSAETKRMVYASLKSAIAEITRLDKISVKTSLWYSSIAEVISCLDIEGWGKFKAEVLEEDREDLLWLEKNRRLSEQEEEKESRELVTEKEKQDVLYTLLQQMTEEIEYRKDREGKKKVTPSQTAEPESESAENRRQLLSQLQKRKEELLLYARESLERISFEKEAQASPAAEYPLPLVAEMVYLMKKEKRKHLSEELSDIFQESSTVTSRRFVEQIQHLIKDIPENPQESLESLEIDWADRERKEVRKAERIIQEEYASVWQAVGEHVEQLFLPDVSSRFVHYPLKLSNVRWLGQGEERQMSAVQIIEQLRQDRMVDLLPLQIYREEKLLTRERNLTVREELKERETSYNPADLTVAQSSPSRSGKNQAEHAVIQTEVQTEVKRQVQEYTDIQFITKGLDPSAAEQTSKDIESLIRQVENQQKEINEIKTKTLAEEKLSRQDMLRLSKTVMKTMKNQLDAERFRYGM